MMALVVGIGREQRDMIDICVEQYCCYILCAHVLFCLVLFLFFGGVFQHITCTAVEKKPV